jgi:hypothetical protein
MVFLRAGRVEEVLDDLQRLQSMADFEIQEWDAEMFFGLAIASHRAGMVGEARQSYERGVRQMQLTHHREKDPADWHQRTVDNFLQNEAESVLAEPTRYPSIAPAPARQTVPGQ